MQSFSWSEECRYTAEDLHKRHAGILYYCLTLFSSIFLLIESVYTILVCLFVCLFVCLLVAVSVVAFISVSVSTPVSEYAFISSPPPPSPPPYSLATAAVCVSISVCEFSFLICVRVYKY